MKKSSEFINRLDGAVSKIIKNSIYLSALLSCLPLIHYANSNGFRWGIYLDYFPEIIMIGVITMAVILIIAAMPVVFSAEDFFLTACSRLIYNTRYKSTEKTIAIGNRATWRNQNLRTSALLTILPICILPCIPLIYYFTQSDNPHYLLLHPIICLLLIAIWYRKSLFRHYLKRKKPVIRILNISALFFLGYFNCLYYTLISATYGFLHVFLLTGHKPSDVELSITICVFVVVLSLLRAIRIMESYRENHMTTVEKRKRSIREATTLILALSFSIPTASYIAYGSSNHTIIKIVGLGNFEGSIAIEENYLYQFGIDTSQDECNGSPSYCRYSSNVILNGDNRILVKLSDDMPALFIPSASLIKNF